MITVVDSGIANIGSVAAAFRLLDVPVEITNRPEKVAEAKALLLPGVGAFSDGMDSLRRYGLVPAIRALAASGAPILGICLGMQLLADKSMEFGEHEGLGLISGDVLPLVARGPRERVPNIGWCDLQIAPRSRLFKDIADGTAFYCVHSFFLRCKDPNDVVAEMQFGGDPIAMAIERNNIFGAQFHPEKSQDAGLAMLSQFATHVRTTVLA